MSYEDDRALALREAAEADAAWKAKPFPDYPPDGSLRHCRRAKLFGVGFIRNGVAQLKFGVDGEERPICVLLSERDMRIIATCVAESQPSTKIQPEGPAGVADGEG